MSQNKWEVKSHSYPIADTGDYDGFWEITNGEINICTKDDGNDMPEILSEVANALNKTECKFYIDNPREIDMQCEIEELKWKLKESEEKATKLLNALKKIVDEGGKEDKI